MFAAAPLQAGEGLFPGVDRRAGTGTTRYDRRPRVSGVLHGQSRPDRALSEAASVGRWQLDQIRTTVTAATSWSDVPTGTPEHGSTLSWSQLRLGSRRRHRIGHRRLQRSLTCRQLDQLRSLAGVVKPRGQARDRRSSAHSTPEVVPASSQGALSTTGGRNFSVAQGLLMSTTR